MLYPGQAFDNPIPLENLHSEDGNWAFVRESDHNKIMNYIKNTDPYEVSFVNDTFIMRINGLYYVIDGNSTNIFINENSEIETDTPPR